MSATETRIGRSIMPVCVEWHYFGPASREQFLACEAVATMMDWHCLPTDRVTESVAKLAADHLGNDYDTASIIALTENCIFERIIHGVA